ncbi:pancreatic prohormone-like [Myotis myotis]|uniref:pancreatic prohormone-like n=1 Tax=Myotis myotis TaxID=51298 RepID=UPI0017492708|nr:pancreatic prohormone-like [Myotis myotis]
MGEGLGGFCLQCPPLLAPQMAAARRCLSLLFLSTCVALLLQPPLGASGDILEPDYPGDDATPEQLAQYAAELRRYINRVTRLRYGKRDQEETPWNFLEWGAPNKVAPR